MSSQTSESIAEAIAETLASSPWEQLEAACSVHAERQELAKFLTPTIKTPPPSPAAPLPSPTKVEESS